MDDRKLKLLVLLLASVMMVPIGLTIGKKLKGGPKHMATLDAGAGRTIEITAQLKAVPNAQLYATIIDPDAPTNPALLTAESDPVANGTLRQSAAFAMANVMDTPPVFTLYRAGDVVAVSTEHYPEWIILTLDFATGDAWPIDGDPAVGAAALTALRDAGTAPDGAQLLESNYLPLVNDRLREEHEAAQAADASPN